MDRIVELSFRHKLAHLGSCLTMYPILERIFATKAARDIVVLSAGHAGLALYAALERERGVNAEELVDEFGVHPSRDPARGITVSSGSLGSAFLVAVGLALADRSRTVHCLLSDGECAEGTVWEGLQFAKRAALRNLAVHVNVNGYSAYDAVDRDGLEERLRAFCPWIVVHQTTNPDFPHMRGLEGHYHVLKSNAEAAALATTVKAAQSAAPSVVVPDATPNASIAAAVPASVSVVITGVGGFIGSHLKDACEARGWVVHGTTRIDTAATTVALLERVRPQFIFHAAAELRNDADMLTTNVLLTHAILEYCRLSSDSPLHRVKRVIVFGSSSEYGRKSKPMAESDVLSPETMYEGTKAAATMISRSYSATYGIPVVVIRPFTVYGPREKPSKLIQLLLSRPAQLKLSEGVHDYVYIADFVAAVFRVVDTCSKPFDIVNVGTGIQTSNVDVVRCVESLTGHKFEIEPSPKKLYDSSSWVCDVSYARAEYGIVAGTSLRDGVIATIAALAKKPEA
jgi:nucleoside-diphosphate-sugar epimerase/transketolase N-terminal domain/subunit